MAEHFHDGPARPGALAEEDLEKVAGGYAPEKIAEAKRQLYDMFMSANYPGVTDRDLTLADVYYTLYNEYIQNKREWSEVQARMKAEIMARYS